MNILFEKSTGKKTYITAAIAIMSAATTYLMGDVTLFEALQLAFTALFAATLRNGLTTEAAAAASSVAK